VNGNLFSVFPQLDKNSKKEGHKNISAADVTKILTFYHCLDLESYLYSTE